ncbi:helix-turn-helix domain-containing protein [Streptomyces sp. IBSBF 3136]|uniref:helix-turn-helix domain-containing protein n=1 Tax=Streptomyces sp. IBSBF 3136 TaxID=2903524 RepID=UPI003FA71871
MRTSFRSRPPRWPSCARLEARRIAKTLTKPALAELAGLGRTTVSAAFSRSASAPSVQTVYALARALALRPGPLLELLALATRATAVPPAGLTQAAGLPAAGTGPVRAVHRTAHADEREVACAAEGPAAGAVGRPIAQCRPHDLGVHPAAEASRHGGDDHSSSLTDRQPQAEPRLPSYVYGPHDGDLADLVAAAAAGSTRMAVLVGSSSTGKTRACWEAVQPLAEQGWLLWHPRYPSHPEAALAHMEGVQPHTVVWLNELQHYLGAGSGTGERIAAALHLLLNDSARAPSWSWAPCVLILLGLLRPSQNHWGGPAPAGATVARRPADRPARYLRPEVDQSC